MVARESSQARREEEQEQEHQEDNCTKSCDIANPEIRVSTIKTTNDDLSQPSSLTHVELSESAKPGRSRRYSTNQASQNSSPIFGAA